MRSINTVIHISLLFVNVLAPFQRFSVTLRPTIDGI